MPRSMIFMERADFEAAMLKLRAVRHMQSWHSYTLRSLVAISPKGERLYTPPHMSSAKGRQLNDAALVKAARDAGWKPCYFVTVKAVFQ